MIEHLDPSLVAALALFIGALTFGVKLIVPELVKAFQALVPEIVRLIRAFAEGMRSRAAAKLEAVTAARIEAEERRLAEENTGRFLTASTKDRAQIDVLVEDVRREVRECHAERVTEREERARERAGWIDELAARDRKIATLEKRIDEVESSRDAIYSELLEVRRSIDSGGAYASPPKGT